MKKINLLSITLLFIGIATIKAQTGNIGIGTNTPTEKLEVNGNMKSATFSTIWTASISYALNYVVLYEGVLYKHLTTTNTATTPDMDAINWGSISSLATTKTPEYLYAKMNADEGVSTGNNIDNLTITASAGDVGNAGFSAGTGVVTLSPGVTYKLTAALNATNTSLFTYLVYQWYDNTNSVEFGNRAFISPSNIAVNGSNQPTAVAYITPTVSTEVYLKIISLTGTNVSIDAEYGYITVDAIANELPTIQNATLETTEEVLTVTSTGTAPTKATTPINDYISATDDGSWTTIDFEYSHTNNAGATTGTGDYLFKLPDGYSFNTSIHPVNTQATFLNGASEIHKLIPLSGIIQADGVYSFRNYVIPYDATHFRIVTIDVNQWYFLSPSNFTLTHVIRTQKGSFRFKKL